MSYATMYPIKMDGTVDRINGVDYRNSWLGAMMIWTDLGKKHGLEVGFTPGKMEAIWALARDVNVPESERIVMAATFDKVWIEKKNFAKLIDAIEQCRAILPANCHAFAWAEKLAEWKNDSTIRGACWQATSVADDQWSIHNQETDESRPVNIDVDDAWEMFMDTPAAKEA